MESGPAETLLGYDKDRFTTPVDDEFICAICLGVLRSPVQLPCEHMFCESCIKRWCVDNLACPNCRRAIQAGLGSCNPPSRALLSLLNKLSIRCQFSDQGCRDLFNLTNIEQHESKCDCRPVPCPLNGCNQMVPKNSLARHITECSRRSQICKTCDLSLQNGESHSKDDCIAALKRALKDCIDLIVQRNAPSAPAQPTHQPQLPHLQPNNHVVVQEHAFDIYFPPVTPHLQNPSGDSDAGSEESDGEVPLHHHWSPLHPVVDEIDLTADDNEQQQHWEGFHHVDDNDDDGDSDGDSAESLMGTHSDVDLNTSGTVPLDRPVETSDNEQADDYDDDTDDTPSPLHRHHDSDDDDSERPKRVRPSSSF